MRLAGYQVQANFGTHNPHVHKPGFLEYVYTCHSLERHKHACLLYMRACMRTKHSKRHNVNIIFVVSSSVGLAHFLPPDYRPQNNFTHQYQLRVSIKRALGRRERAETEGDRRVHVTLSLMRLDI
jgi:hypothetical protein